MSFPLGFLLRLFFAAVVLVPAPLLIAQAVRKPLPLHDAVQDKDFYLLSAMQADPPMRTLLVTDKALAQVAAERQRFVAQALHTCKGEAICLMKPFLWTDEEIRIVSFALARLHHDNILVRQLVEKHLRPSGTYALYQKQRGDTLLVNAWEICARGMNDVVAVYGQGVVPRYPLIDSISFDVGSTDFQQHVSSLIQQISVDTAGIFFDPSLKVALQLLTLNHRDEGGRYEPMETTVNEPAFKAVAYTRWDDFPYSVIVVPGAGPSDRDIALSDSGRRRTALAAEAYHAGKAPFILVSGGHVHPSQTRFAEAVEMKKALLQDYHVPETAILIDPHARHTTTNMRNAAREIYRYDIPFTKPALAISDATQINSIASEAFANRCLKEMGYLPYQVISRPSDTSLVFLPLVESLQQDPLDPLDP